MITIDLEHEQWYQSMIEECKAALTEGMFGARWIIIETYHNIGKRILEEEQNFTKAGYLKMSQRVSDSLGKSQRTIEQAIQFARKFPDLEALPAGKNVSWHKICTELLPEPKEKETTEECKHLFICQKCGKKYE